MKQYFLHFILFLFCVILGYTGKVIYFSYQIQNMIYAEQKTVEIDLFYGLGNNMFQYAAGLAYAQEHHKKLYVRGNVHNLENAFETQTLPLNKKETPTVINASFIEKRHNNLIDSNQYTRLYGLFQNEKYFKKYRKKILEAFQFKKDISDINKDYIYRIQKTNSIALHIRRGDYLKIQNAQHILSIHYYNRAIDYITQHVKKPHFFIFSDDIEWAKKNIKISHPHTFVTHNRGNDSYNDMRLMSLCKHNIIANSTFSWWGAWLNQNPDKIVIAPDVWLKNDKTFIHSIVPDNWIKLSDKANIAILYIATGRYIVFFDEFYKSMEKNFLINDNKTYFVWTDSDRDFPPNVIKIKIPHLGWPKATLYRYNFFQNSWDKLKNFDYMYYLNANMIALRPVGREIFPSDEQGIMATLHPGYYKSTQNLPYDRNPKSLAYIPFSPTLQNTSEKYFMGGFNGGTATAFKQLIDTIALNTKIDEQNGVIARWHDESHFNKYLYNKKPLILTPAYGYPQNSVGNHATYTEFHKTHKLLILDKSDPKWGGHSYLRGITNTPLK